ncbi:hypothetical protein FOL47_004768 [Perkinsus chesapeaki]|uniref:Uncharacterized protein n=1 Tax=Perkinsus chesapeaki TaxID=330153 RepID=A0A7J6MZL3_PERCH|nr:hypothetical protein FOL47_004768 [Perkinsus chesapeaki]
MCSASVCPLTTGPVPKAKVPVSEERVEISSTPAQEDLPPLPTRPTAVLSSSTPLAVALRPPPPRPAVPVATSETSSTPPPALRPSLSTSVESTRTVAPPLSASPSPLSSAPPPPPRREIVMPGPEIMNGIFGETGLVSRYLALQRSQERSALLTEEERPQQGPPSQQVAQRPRPPKPQFRAPDWISPKGKPWWSPAVLKSGLTRPLGFAAVLTDQLVAEDWADLFGDVHPSGEEVLEMQALEAEELSKYSPISDRGGYYVAQALSTGTALYFAAVDSLPGTSFTPRACQWSVFLDPFHDEEYSWIDTVIVDSLPTVASDDDWRQAELRKRRSSWDISDDVS